MYLYKIQGGNEDFYCIADSDKDAINNFLGEGSITEVGETFELKLICLCDTRNIYNFP